MPWWRDTSSPVHSARHRALDCDRGCISDDTCGPAGALSKLLAGGDLGDETDLACPLRGHPLVGAEQRHAHDFMERHLGEHLDRFEGRRHAVGDVRIEERGVFGGDDELDLAQHVEGTAARHSLHRGDHWLPAVARLRSDVASRVVVHPGSGVAREVAGRHRVRVRLGDGFGAVDPGAEGFALGGEHDAPHVVVVPDVVPDLPQFLPHAFVDRVADLRAIERQPCDAVVLVEQERLEARHTRIVYLGRGTTWTPHERIRFTRVTTSTKVSADSRRLSLGEERLVTRLDVVVLRTQRDDRRDLHQRFAAQGLLGHPRGADRSLNRERRRRGDRLSDPDRTVEELSRNHDL